MRYLLIIVTTLLLAACGGDTVSRGPDLASRGSLAADAATWRASGGEVDPLTGITVVRRGEPERNPTTRVVGAALTVAETCVGVPSHEPPVVVLMARDDYDAAAAKHQQLGNGAVIVYSAPRHTVVVLAAGAAGWRVLDRLVHEFVHHLLREANAVGNDDHASPFFERCRVTETPSWWEER